MDRARGNFSLKESQLATMLLAAANISRKSDSGKQLLDWKKQGGNFAETAEKVSCPPSWPMTSTSANHQH